MSASTAQVLVFHAGGQALAVPADAVSEVVPTPKLTRVPHGPPALLGLANVRGRVLPVVSLGAWEAGRVVVLEGQDVGLAVDRIDTIRDEAGAARPLDIERLLADALTAGEGRGRAPRVQGGAGEAATAVAEAEIGFLQFDLAGQAYALPLEQVREVAPVPSDLRSLPRTDAAMLGVASLRGRLLPLVSPAALLGLAPPASMETAKIVVTRIGDAEVGLLVEGVRRVLRVTADRIGAVPSVLNRGAGEARIDCVVRTADGLVSVLAAERIFADETVAAIVAEASAAPVDAQQTEDRGAMERFVLFRLGDERYGLPASAVEEVVRLPAAPTRVPRAPAFVVGVINHRGDAVPLIDQSHRFSAAAGVERRRRVIVAKLDDVKVGFIVDDVEQVIDLPESALRPAPDLAAGDTPVFDRIADIEHEGRLVLLIDPRRLLDQAERDLLKALAAKTGSA